jgi:hypothetical protein
MAIIVTVNVVTEIEECCVCGVVKDREELQQCVECELFMCVMHVCSCPIPGVDAA